MSEFEAFEAKLTQALEQQPVVVVPETFAARVRAALPAQPVRRQRMSARRVTGVVGASVLVVALCWLAPHAAPSFSSLAFDMELLLLAELAGVAMWLGSRRV